MRKWLIIASFIIVTSCLGFLYSFKPENSLAQQDVIKEHVTFWYYSEEMIKEVYRFEEDYPHIKVITRLVKNPEILLEELYAAVSAGNSPDIAEIPSWYGVYPLIENGSIFPVNDLLDNEYKAELPNAITKRFQMNNELWAIPISYEVPTLYIHEAYLGQIVQNMDTPAALPKVMSENKFPNIKWSINADNNYPWYLIHLKNQNNSIVNNTEIDLIASNKYFLFHKNHLALTEFVNGEGGILMSSSSKLQLVEKQIGNKFKWKVAPFPMEETKIIPNGNGLVAFKKDEILTNNTKQFLLYMQKEERLKSFALESSTIPANKQLVESKSFQDNYRYFPDYQRLLITSLAAEGRLMTADDGLEWNKLIESNENRR